jgi:hypothetical protein
MNLPLLLGGKEALLLALKQDRLVLLQPQLLGINLDLDQLDLGLDLEGGVLLSLITMPLYFPLFHC